MSRFQTLLQGYKNDSLSWEELNELIALINANENHLQASIFSDLEQNSFAGLTDAVQRQKMYDRILVRTRRGRVIPLWTKAAAAAIIILSLSIGGYFYLNNKEKQIAKTETKEKPYKNDIAPGSNKAILTLANGKQIVLDSAANGTLAQQGTTKIIKLDSGQLAYQSSSSFGEAGVRPDAGLNTITTPRGGQYQIVLADGSKVWLNAASSLQFPTAFTGKERNVELTGEGYFEVAHNAKMPFHVKVKDVLVQVLGTHFNINAYDDENLIKTTLLEGSVKVSTTKNQQSTIIKPGEQAQIENNLSSIHVTHDVDVDQVVAWKNGMFSFKGADIGTIMRQVSKWYDVDVVYEGKIPSGHYNGKTSRNLNASEMLQVLEESGIKFSIEGKRIIIKESQ